ncbi:MAG: NAD(P)-dependent oxidoreductase [Acholeplasmatales bacterium]|nr:NAD(P)-dependent oxidoreductase [Acholeplasmatales bacterium]
MKNIIVFGATGNIGVYLIDYLNENIDSEFKVYACGRRKTDFFKRYNIEYINIDITKKEDFNKLPKESYAVVNLAGILPAYYKDFNPNTYIDTNITGAINILEYARSSNADRVLYTQTWADLEGYWGKEEVLKPDMPRNLSYTGDHAFYAITKCMVLDTMEFYKREFGIKNFVFRLPNIYLYNPNKYYYVNGEKKYISYRYLIDKISNGDDIELWGNPDAFKDIIYVKDLCQMMYLAIKANVNGGTYNAGTGVKTSFQDQIDGMIKVFGSSNKIIYKPEKPTFTSFVMDISNAKKDLGYSPKYSYIDYLEDYKKEQELKRFDEIWK